MNRKNISKIVAVALTVSAFSTIVPNIPGVGVGVEKVYASSDNESIDSITIKKSGGSEIKIYTKSSMSSKYKLDDKDEVPDEMYIKPSSSVKKIDIDIDADSKWEVDKIKTDKETYDEGDFDDMKIGTGDSTIKIYMKEKDGKGKETYTIEVKRDDDKDSNDNDDLDATLEDITLKHSGDKIDFNFDEDKANYDIKVKNDVDYVKVIAEPKDEDEDTVRVNDVKVRESDDWESDKIELKEGKNTITVEVKDEDDDEGTYKINITREAKASTNTNTNTDTNTNTNTNTNVNTNKGWKQEYGKWYYYNDLGAKLTNQWFYDRGYGQTYYLKADGSMATGWLQAADGKWYYLGTNGAKTTGWQLVGGTWYYLDSTGAMQTGWFKDKDGKFYYLNASGAMLKNTTVQGYKLGSDGAWIRR